MTDLDDFFGPRPEPQEIDLPKNTRSWRCSNQLWSTLDAFINEWPELMPEGSKSTLYRATEELLAEIGEPAGPRFIKWASQVIRYEKPELISGMKDPRSLKFLIGQWRREKGGEVCLECGQDMINCPHEWGSERRGAKYGEAQDSDTNG